MFILHLVGPLEGPCLAKSRGIGGIREAGLSHYPGEWETPGFQNANTVLGIQLGDFEARRNY